MPTRGIMHQDKPAVFEPKDVSSVAVHSFPGSHLARMYPRIKLSSFWDSILNSVTSRNALRKLSQKLIVFSNKKQDPGSFTYYAPRFDSFVDDMISTGLFKDRFFDTFRPVAFFLENCGIYFFVFLFF